MIKLVAILASTVALSGCMFNRFNHLHSNANQTTALGAVTNFQNFTSETTGAIATRLTNLNAQIELTQTVESNKVFVGNVVFANNLNTWSWDELRHQLALGWGITEPADRKLQGIVDTKLEKRIQKVSACGAVLDALAAAENAQVVEAAGRLAKANAALAAAAKGQIQVQTNITSLSALAQQFALVVEQAGSVNASNQLLRAQAETLEDRVLQEAEASRDPASAHALAAISGTGLSDADLATLDGFVAEMDKRLILLQVLFISSDIADAGALVKKLRDNGDPYSTVLMARFSAVGRRFILTNSAPADASGMLVREFNALVTRSNRIFNSAELEDVKLPPRTRALMESKNLSGVDLEEFNRRTLEAIYTGAIVPMDSKWTGPVAQGKDKTSSGSAWDEFGEKLQVARSLVHLVQQPPAAPGGAATLSGNRRAAQMDMLSKSYNPNNLKLLQPIYFATNIVVSTKKASLGMNLLRQQAQALRKNLGTGSIMEVVTNVIAAKVSTPALGFFVLTNALPLANIDGIFAANKVLTTNDVKRFGQMLVDAANEKNAAAQRLLAFFSDLVGIELNLYQENHRHYQALTLVSTKELKRWQTMKTLNDRYKTAFQTPAANLPLNDRLSSLFFVDNADIQSAEYTGMLTAAGLEITAEPQFTNLHRPFKLGPAAPILPSMRLLAANAAEWQKKSPMESDPLGVMARASNSRLWAATKLTEGYTLAVGLNRFYAAADTLILEREIKEHDILLDGVESRVKEAEIRLRLGDVSAFHSSGITEQDLLFIVNLAETAGVYYIGAKH